MYQEYFSLKEPPFSIAPNPLYMYMSERHREALAHLVYGIQSDGGFILLTGEVGTGKTTVCRCLLEQITDDVDIAFILNPRLTAVELLATICDDLGIDYPRDASIKVLVDGLNRFLLNSHRQGRKTVVIIDEAQNLTADVLEQLRLLTNLETNEHKLLKIVLLGQPELLELLASRELRQLNQRITARFHLEALRPEEVFAYIRHRLQVAGVTRTLFPRRVIHRIIRLSGGIPRLVNLICDRALLGAYAENRPVVTMPILNRAAREVLGRSGPSPVAGPLAAKSLAASIAAVLVVASIATATWFRTEIEGLVDWPPTRGTDRVAVSPPPAAIEDPATPTGLVFMTDPADDADPAVILTPVSDLVGHEKPGDAFSDLFALWGVTFGNDTTPPCEQAASIGLACHSDLGGMKEIEYLNRPLVIGINDQWFTLSRLKGTVATLISGNRQYEVNRSELARVWNGKYTLFWRTPPGYEHPLMRGDDGAAVDWLASELSRMEPGFSTDAVGNVFDDRLERRLKRFQQAQGLTPNGIADVRTWIRLNGVEAINLPLLNGGDA